MTMAKWGDSLGGKAMAGRALALLALAVCSCGMAGETLRVARIFGSNMVLQRDAEVPIWGWAAPGEKVTVSFAGQKHEAVAGEDGRWQVKLSPMPASKEGQELLVSGGTDIRLSQVLVGDVWVCSGQSNMEWGLANSLQGEKERSEADYPLLRHIKIQNNHAMTLASDISSQGWSICSPATAGGFTAVGYFFGREILRDQGIPIGLIGANWGGTRIEPWTAPQGFALVPELQAISQAIASWDLATQAGQDAAMKYLETVKAWLAQAQSDVTARRIPAPAPAAPWPVNDHQQPTKIYNSVLGPIIPYAIRGAIWYQGESNGNEGASYTHKLKALVGGWRQLWGQGDFPFYLVQLANFQKSNPEKPEGGDGWAKLREAQLQALSQIPNTGMAVIIDIGDANDIHPRNKQDVGQRLALWALAKSYGKDIVCSGPLYKKMAVEGQQIRIEFDHVGSGLMVGAKEGLAPAKEVEEGKLTWFAIAGKDKVWHWADAQIDGGTVLVSCDAVPEPAAVRYAFAHHPEGCNLYNKEGLPASPFRTDDW